jgi:hypothetical protein
MFLPVRVQHFKEGGVEVGGGDELAHCMQEPLREEKGQQRRRRTLAEQRSDNLNGLLCSFVHGKQTTERPAGISRSEAIEGD